MCSASKLSLASCSCMCWNALEINCESWFVFNSFTWSDGKLNSSNLLLLSGQVVEHFDLQFRILYAQSMPISPKWPSSCRNSGIFDHLANRVDSPKEYTVEGNLRAEFARLSSTPKKFLKKLDQVEDTPGEKPCNLGRSFLCEEVSFSDQEAIVERKSSSTQTGPWEEKPVVTVCNAATQTSAVTTETGTQTSVAARTMGTQTSVLLKTAVTQTRESEYTETPLLHRKLSKEESSLSGKAVPSSSLRSLSSSSSQCSLGSSTGSLSSVRSFEYSSSHRAEYFQKLHKERQFHYSTIRSKLSHMVDILSRRRRVPENYMTQYTGRCNLKQRRDISASLRSLQDISLFSLNKWRLHWMRSTKAPASNCSHFVPANSSTFFQYIYSFNTHIRHSAALCFILCNLSNNKEGFIYTVTACILFLYALVVKVHFNSGCLTWKVNLLLLSRIANALALIYVNMEKSELDWSRSEWLWRLSSHQGILRFFLFFLILAFISTLSLAWGVTTFIKSKKLILFCLTSAIYTLLFN